MFIVKCSVRFVYVKCSVVYVYVKCYVKYVYVKCYVKYVYVKCSVRYVYVKCSVGYVYVKCSVRYVYCTVLCEVCLFKFECMYLIIDFVLVFFYSVPCKVCVRTMSYVCLMSTYFLFYYVLLIRK